MTKTKKEVKHIKRLVKLSLIHSKKRVRKKNWKRILSILQNTTIEVFSIIVFYCRYFLNCKAKDLLNSIKHNADYALDTNFTSSISKPIDNMLEVLKYE